MLRCRFTSRTNGSSLHCASSLSSQEIIVHLCGCCLTWRAPCGAELVWLCGMCHAHAGRTLQCRHCVACRLARGATSLLSFVGVAMSAKTTRRAPSKERRKGLVSTTPSTLALTDVQTMPVLRYLQHSIEVLSAYAAAHGRRRRSNCGHHSARRCAVAAPLPAQAPGRPAGGITGRSAQGGGRR